jgi:SAM-dependent methyltransferase
MLTETLRHWLSPMMFLRVRQLRYAPLELFERFTGRAQELTPPRWLHFVGAGDFRTVGERFLGYFREIGGLQPHESVLDVGCGVGRMAIPLASYLSAQASYCGFDIVKPAIDWCQSQITPRFPNFQFVHANIQNDEYNPRGLDRAEQYRFPYDDSRFDFIFLTSVFTHMLPAGTRNYLQEMKRVLRPQGRIFVTAFLLDQISKSLMSGEASLFHFQDSGKGYWTTHLQRPEAVTAYTLEELRAMLEAAGLRIIEPIHWGSWSGRPASVEGQDILLLTHAA